MTETRTAPDSRAEIPEGAISETVRETDGKGGFARQNNSFHASFGDEAGQLPVEAGRYRLIAALICPWAHRQLIVRELLGLQDAISVGIVDPRRTPDGWRFALDPDG